MEAVLRVLGEKAAVGCSLVGSIVVVILAALIEERFAINPPGRMAYLILFGIPALIVVSMRWHASWAERKQAEEALRRQADKERREEYWRRRQRRR